MLAFGTRFRVADDDDVDDGTPGSIVLDDATLERKRVEKRFETLIRSLMKPYDCMICTYKFKQADNLLGYFCQFHPGKIRVDPRTCEEKWTCCNRGKTFIGCRDCLHVASESIKTELYSDPIDSIFEIPADLIDYNLVLHDKRMFVSREAQPSPTNSINAQVLAIKHGKYSEMRADPTKSSGTTPIPYVELFYFIRRASPFVRAIEE
ncbi:MAG: hypothetical protein BVN35_17835 [Proteobacteria bacterium ST_bin11]|nr:MAG: hypothetical protein BVN35_17835 [Proteobacteria bacterium ST_bin11]